MKDISELTNLEFCNLLDTAEIHLNGGNWNKKLFKRTLNKCGMQEIEIFLRNYKKLHSDEHQEDFCEGCHYEWTDLAMNICCNCIGGNGSKNNYKKSTKKKDRLIVNYAMGIK